MQLFAEMDQNNDSSITKEEFVSAILSSDNELSQNLALKLMQGLAIFSDA